MRQYCHYYTEYIKWLLILQYLSFGDKEGVNKINVIGVGYRDF